MTEQVKELIEKLSTSDKAKVFDITAKALADGGDVSAKFIETLNWLVEWK